MSYAVFLLSKFIIFTVLLMNHIFFQPHLSKDLSGRVSLLDFLTLLLDSLVELFYRFWWGQQTKDEMRIDYGVMPVKIE